MNTNSGTPARPVKNDGARRMRDNLYDRIPLSVRTMNIIIAAVSAAIVILLVVDILAR